MYYKLPKQEFEQHLKEIKNSQNTIHILESVGDSYFYFPTNELNDLFLKLNQKQWELDYLFQSFSSFAKKQLVQSFLIQEIEATNKIENIHSTKHDIFSIMQQASKGKDKKIISIANAYRILLESSGKNVTSFEELKQMYDQLLEGAIDKENLVDGLFFRKGDVWVSNGLNIIHSGVRGEEKIALGMKEFLNVYNSSLELYEKMILSHFIFEIIHPYYDGNGRMGRYLFSNGIYLKTTSLFSFLVSFAIANEKEKYYKAFKAAEDPHEFGCLNQYIEIFANILLHQLESTLKDLYQKKEKIKNLKKPMELTKSEGSIYSLIAEATILSDYGVSNEEIMKETGVSKRTLIYTLNHFKENELLEETKVGRFVYHKLIF